MSRHNRHPAYPSNLPEPPRQLSLFAAAPRGSGLLPSAELDAIVSTALAPGELLKIDRGPCPAHASSRAPAVQAASAVAREAIARLGDDLGLALARFRVLPVAPQSTRVLTATSTTPSSLGGGRAPRPMLSGGRAPARLRAQSTRPPRPSRSTTTTTRTTVPSARPR